MEALALDVNYPEQCVQSLKKLEELIEMGESGLQPVLEEVFELETTNEPDILHELLHLAKKALKQYSGMYERAASLLRIILSAGHCAVVSYPLLVDLFLAIIYCAPQEADILIDQSLPAGSLAIFPSDLFAELFPLFLQAHIPKPLVQCMVIRLLQFKDVYFHALAVLCRFKELGIAASKQLAELSVALLLHEEIVNVFYLPDIAEFLAIPVGSEFKCEFYMRLVPKEVEEQPTESKTEEFLLDEPVQKPELDKLDAVSGLRRRTLLKLSNNAKFKEREFECFYELPYKDAEFITQLKERFLSIFIAAFTDFYASGPEQAVQVLEAAEKFDMTEHFDSLQRLYAVCEGARLPALRLLVGAERSDKYVHDVYTKIYDNINADALDRFRSNSAIFEILREVIRNPEIEMPVKQALLCKMVSYFPLLGSVSLFISVLLVFSAVLRNPPLRHLISCDSSDAVFSACEAVQDKSFAEALEFAELHLSDVNFLELLVVKSSAFEPLFEYFDRLATGECLADDLDLDHFIQLKLAQAIRSKMDEKISAFQPDEDVVFVQRRLFEGVSDAEYRPFVADFESSANSALKEFLSRELQKRQESDLVAGLELKEAKVALQRQLEAEMSGFFAWKSGDVETKVARARWAGDSSENEPIEETWGGFNEE